MICHLNSWLPLCKFCKVDFIVTSWEHENMESVQVAKDDAPPTPTAPPPNEKPEWWTCVCRFQAHSAAVRLDPIKNSSLWIPCQSLEVKSRPDVPAPQHVEHTRCQKKWKKEKAQTVYFLFFPLLLAYLLSDEDQILWYRAHQEQKQKQVVLRCLCPSVSAAL